MWQPDQPRTQTEHRRYYTTPWGTIPYNRRSPIVEAEVMVRRLVTPAVYDVVAGVFVAPGPKIDDEVHWRDYRKAHPEHRYAIAKRTLSMNRAGFAGGCFV